MANTTGNDAAATEHAEEPQLAELLNQEAGLTSVIELKVVRNQAIEYYYKREGTQVLAQKVQVVLQSKIPNQYCLGVAKMQKKTKLSSGKLRTAGRQVPRGNSEPSSSSTRSLPFFTPHAASLSICVSHRPRRCYRARTSHQHQCQQSPSQTYSN